MDQFDRTPTQPPPPATEPRWSTPLPQQPWSGAWAAGAAPSVPPMPVGVHTTPLTRPAPRRRVSGQALLVAALCVLSALLGAAVVVGTRPASPLVPLAASGTTLTAVATPTPAPVVAASPATSGTGQTAAADSADTESVIVRVAGSAGPAVVTIQVSAAAGNTGFGQGGTVSGSGSGVIFDAGGWILTNRHVVNEATSVTVRLADGREFPGTVKGIDTLTDLAIVKVEGTGLPTAPLGDSSAVRIGQTAIAIGNPLGEFAGSVTSGIVSGLDRQVDISDRTSGSSESLRHLIQTDAAINPGNSGGPLLDAQGRVVGINTAEAGQAQGIGFAIPVDLAKPIIAQALQGVTLSRPWIGINYGEITAQIATTEKLPIDHGAWIHADTGAPIVAGSPAEKAGLRDGDIITALDGQTVDTAHPLDGLLLRKLPGDTVTLTVRRGTASIELKVTLGTRPAGLQ